MFQSLQKVKYELFCNLIRLYIFFFLLCQEIDNPRYYSNDMVITSIIARLELAPIL